MPTCIDFLCFDCKKNLIWAIFNIFLEKKKNLYLTYLPTASWAETLNTGVLLKGLT